MPIEIRALEVEDDRSDFRSGDVDLDRFFRKYAGQNQFRHHIGVTYVAVEKNLLMGFATVSAAEIHIDVLPEARRARLPRYPLPVLRLARLAVDQRYAGRGLGSALLKTVFELARRMERDVGCVGVVVDAKPAAVTFYERYGFEPAELLQGGLGDRPEPTLLFLPLGAIPD